MTNFNRSSAVIERRYAELRAAAEGRTLSGDVVVYGEVSTGLPWRERIEPGAFQPLGDVRLNLQHQRTVLLARTGGGGLVLEDGPNALRMRAELPSTTAADDTLALVRAGVLRGLSVEMHPRQERQVSGVRSISRARLSGLSVVDSGAWDGARVEARAEVRAEGEGLVGAFMYSSDTIISDRAAMLEVRARGARKQRVVPGAFRFALQDESREIQLLLGRDYDRPLASRQAGTLELMDSPDALRFRVDRLPETTYVADFRAQQEAGAAVFGVAPMFRIPPSDVVPDALVYAPEPAADGGAIIETVHEAVLTALAIVSRAPRGNPGVVSGQGRRWVY